MDVEVFVHGVPYGEDFWGNDNREGSFLSTFYNGQLDALKLVVRTRILENKRYTYYSYIVSKDVLDSYGRPGSYFGLTIRFDSYYKDFMRVFYILDLVFQRNILGDILNRKGDGFQYKISKFADAKISDIESCIGNLIRTYFDSKNVSTLSNVAENKTSVKLNIYDASQQSVQEAIQKGAIVSLSPYFESVSQKNIQKACAEQVTRQQKAFDSQLANVNSQLERMEKENTDKEQAKIQLQNEISNLEGNKSILEKKVTNLESILNQIRQLLSSVGGPATPRQGKPGQIQSGGKNLDNTTTGKETENEDPNKPTKESGRIKIVLLLLKIIQPILVILVLIIEVALFARMPDKQMSDQKKAEQEVAQNDTLSNQDTLEFKVYQVKDEKTKELILEPLQELQKGNKWYAAKVNNPYTDTDNVQWTIEGAKPGKIRNDTIVTFQVAQAPKDSVVRISCVKDGSGSYKELKVK